MTLQELEKEAQELAAKQGLLRDKIERAKTQEAADARRPLRELAALAHSLFCSYNHTDGCSWRYEENSDVNVMWACPAHERWLNNIAKIVDRERYGSPLTVEEVKVVLEWLVELKAQLGGQLFG